MMQTLRAVNGKAFGVRRKERGVKFSRGTKR
jgi:hypothetical protein